MTINDWRREVGLSEETGGDVFLVPSGVVAVRDLQGVNQFVGQPSSTPASEPAPAKSAPEIETKSATVRSAAEAEHSRTLGEYFEARRKDVLATVGGKAALVNRQRWDTDLTDRLYRASLAAATAAGVAAWGDYDKSRTEGYQFKRAQGIAADMNAALAQAAQDAIVETDPTQAVAALFDGYKDRTPNLALTLVTAALGWGATEAGRQATSAGAKATKTWSTGRNPRPSHAAMDGQTVGIDELFSNGMKFPGDGGNPDDTAGCNCDVTVTVK